MFWSKMRRWTLIGVVGVSGASACGGRGNLPGGEATGSEPFGGTGAGSPSGGGTRAFGGATAVGGATSSSGSPAFGGVTSAGGTFTFAGSSAIAGTTSVGGAPAVCVPGRVKCDAVGRFVQVCAPDGQSAANKLDCFAQGQRCRDGACRSLVCQPNQLFCDKAGVRLCNADGSASTASQNCAANQYCDSASLSCKQGICAPGQPTCNGSIATTCNANGSGYVGLSQDCAKQVDLQCVAGVCSCAAPLADCDDISNNGCEVNTATSPDNCTGCFLVCSSNHVPVRTCDNACDGACEAGFQDCNGDKLKDGCETSTSGDLKNCGGCGLACSANHVTASCTSGACDGACDANFADCNANKQIDGCESDPRVDAKNCGACGTACSTNHVKPVCAAGACSGDCAVGFADCNANKQSDGCEINTQTDKLNCGGCGNACATGMGCVAGQCTSLYTFTGIAQNVPIASLTGWSQCFADPYGQSGSSLLAKVESACSGSLLMMACRAKGSDTLQVAAYAPRTDVLFDTGQSNVLHVANGVGWYFNDSWSWGFAPPTETVQRNTCDVGPSLPDQRLCWHTGNGWLQGGYRCGSDEGLNDSSDFERLLFQVP